MKSLFALLVSVFFICSVAFAYDEPLVIGVTDVEHGKSELAKMKVKIHKVLKHSKAISVTGDKEKLKGLPWVRYVEPDPPDAMWVHEDGLDWGVNKIDGDVFWGGSQGAVNVTPGMGGLGVKVGVIDTGIDCTHPDLKDNCIYGANFSTSGTTAADDYGHGTHVAGTIGSRDNGLGYIGVAPEATLYAVKVLSSSGSGSNSSVAAGIDWATDNGMQVINMSLGGGSSQVICDAVAAAHAAGIVVVASAGNAGCCDTIGSPANCPGAIAVGATDSSDGVASFSSTGKALWVSAPGVNIWSTVPTGTCSLCSPTGYRALNGTSMASPHVAGAVALLVSMGFGNDEIKNKLANGAVQLGSPGWDMYYGHGRINAMTALSAPDTPPPGAIDTTPPGNIVITSPIPNTSITTWGIPVTFTATATDDGGSVSYSFYTYKAGGLYSLCHHS